MTRTDIRSERNQLGQQIIRRLTQTGVTIHSVYGPDGNRIAEYNEATGALIRQYIWREGAPIAVIEGGVISFVRSDHIGRPVFATDSSGVKVWTAAYLPFGGVRVSTGTPPTARFPGQWFQSETGLHQNWMRDYDPTTGRYMQADPLGLVDGASVYGYARQSPGRYVDPRGEEGALATFRRNYREMREANWRESDRYFHCRANCQAVREFENVCYDETSPRYQQSIYYSNLRERFDQLTGDDPISSMGDQAANWYGRDGAVNSPLQSCQEICERYRPEGLPSRY